MSRERFEVGALQAHLEARRAKSRSSRSKAAEASVALAIAHPPTVWAAFSRAVQERLEASERLATRREARADPNPNPKPKPSPNTNPNPIPYPKP